MIYYLKNLDILTCDFIIILFDLETVYCSTEAILITGADDEQLAHQEEEEDREVERIYLEQGDKGVESIYMEHDDRGVDNMYMMTGEEDKLHTRHHSISVLGLERGGGSSSSIAAPLMRRRSHWFLGRSRSAYIHPVTRYLYISFFL